MFHAGASSEPILCSRPGVLLQRQHRAAPDLPSAWDSNASIFAVAILSCVSEFVASFALGRDKLIVYGRQRSPLVSSSQRQQVRLEGVSTLSHACPFSRLLTRYCSTTVSTRTQHNNPTNIASMVTVSLSVYVWYVTVILRLVSSLVIDPSAPAESMSRGLLSR